MIVLKVLLSVAISLSILVSILYEVYSRDSQMFYVHKIGRGTLSVSSQLAENANNITQSINMNTQMRVNVQLNQNTNALNNIQIVYRNAKIIKTNGVNFLGLAQSKGDIKAHGDSFYQIKDKPQKLCINQIIQQIQLSDDFTSIIMKGKFYDCQKSEYSMKLQIKNKNQLQMQTKLIGNTSKYNRLLIYFEHKPQHNYLGLGEQFSHLNLGHNRPFSLFVRQKGVGRTDQPQTSLINMMYGAGGNYYNTYSPTPIWYSIWLDNSSKGQDKNKNKATSIGYALNSFAYSIWMNNFIIVWGTSIQVKVFVGDTVKQVIKCVTNFNGYTPPVPHWVNKGAIVGLQGGTQSVVRKYQVLRRHQVQISGLWLQDWVNKRRSLGYSRLWWNWQLDGQHYKNWHAMSQQLHAKHIKLLIYINPMLSDVENQKQKYNTNYYKQAKQNQHFIKLQDAKNFQTSAFSDWKASMIDFDKQQSKQFFKQILRKAIKQTNTNGLMIDFGEAYPIQNTNLSIEQATAKHNQYATKYHKVAREVLDQFKQKQMYTFSRAGYLFAPKYTLSLWAGDQSMNFKRNSGLPSCLTAMLSSSLVGYSNTHCDIGGYTYFQLPFSNTSVRNQILMTRWMQLGAFSPVFRTHEGNLPQKTLQVYSNQQIASQFAFYSYIFTAMAHYRQKQAKKSQKQGVPLIRPMFIQHQNDEQTYKIGDQYYLGEDILVIPYMEAQHERKYYLPQGKWVNIWDGVQQQGCNCYLQNRQLLPKVYIKAQSNFKYQIISLVKRAIRKFSKKVKYLQKSHKTQQL